MNCILQNHQILCWSDGNEVKVKNTSYDKTEGYDNLVVAYGYFKDDFCFYVANKK